MDAVRDAGVAEEHIYVDKRTGANMDRAGLRALLGFARPGDRINVPPWTGWAGTCARP
ncbi:hypothetical protein AB0A77_17635 [Streptomyces varsoviensis]|uniref:hypothetical protein n=1 Tax=Streptomyces varsoviensis TaxID=67373 RepID=UPI0033DD96B0